MNLDERLEALTQSVELLASMHKDYEKRFDRLTDRNLELEQALSKLTQGTVRLLQVVEAHEQRISGLEGHQSQ